MCAPELVNTCIFLRRLGVHGVEMLYYYTVLLHGLATFLLSSDPKFKIKRAGKIVDVLLSFPHSESVIQQGLKVTEDKNHIFNKYQFTPSGKSFRAPNCKLNRYKFSIANIG